MPVVEVFYLETLYLYVCVHVGVHQLIRVMWLTGVTVHETEQPFK